MKVRNPKPKAKSAASNNAVRPSFHLLKQLLRRDIAARYRGSLLGLFWALLTPLMMLSVYSFVFGIVFRTRWQMPEGQTPVAFPLLLYSGLIIHQFTAEILTRSTTIILQSSNYVKKVVFPLEILPVIIILSAGFMALIQFGLLIAATLAMGTHLPATILYLPVIWLPLILLAQGAAWLVASMGVFLRDLAQLMGFLVTMLLFLSPVFFPVSSLPEPYRTFMQLNPLTPVIEMTRNAMFYGLAPDWTVIAIQLAIGIAIFFLGYAWFHRTRKGFNDVV